MKIETRFIWRSSDDKVYANLINQNHIGRTMIYGFYSRESALRAFVKFMETHDHPKSPVEMELVEKVIIDKRVSDESE